MSFQQETIVTMLLYFCTSCTYTAQSYVTRQNETKTKTLTWCRYGLLGTQSEDFADFFCVNFLTNHHNDVRHILVDKVLAIFVQWIWHEAADPVECLRHLILVKNSATNVAA